MRKHLNLFALAAILLTGCSGGSGITVKLDDGSKVNVDAVTDEIIHVTAVPKGAKFSDKESLIVLPQTGSPSVSVEKTDTKVILKTAKLIVNIDKASGAVSYFDLDGKEYTSEESRSFAPFEADGTKAWTVRQVFNSSDDEGFYGLGQHQADEWNYKGKNEELYQYNTKISIPFIVSSKKYGILWDSYSFCRWGDPRGYAQLGDVFKLYDKDGVEGALTGTYTARNGSQMVRKETALAQEYLITPECQVVRNAPESPRGGWTDVLFEGELEPSETGLFKFYLYYAGYTRVLLDGKEVMPKVWRTAWNPNGRKFEANLEAGKRVSLRVEWQPDGATSYDAIRVLSPVSPEEQAKMSWWGEMQDQIDYYFIAGDKIDNVISGYRTLTGKAPIMPKWVLGFWQSRERYKTQDEVTGILDDFREKQVPVDNIVLDWQYWEPDKWGSHEFDASRFPDPKGMVDHLHEGNAHFMISVWPKFYVGTEHFNELDKAGYIYRVPVDQKVIDWLGYEQSFYDPYAQEARDMFWGQMYDHLYPIGVDAWWMDASEPNIHDCTDMDFRKAMSGPTAIGPVAQYFNTYALLNAQAIYEGQRSVDPDRRVFLLTRNGFAGLQRYSTASWSGDIGSSWEDMKAQISAGLNYSISGIPFWGQDIGGFSVQNRYSFAQTLFERTGKVTPDLEEWRELNVRWHEWGVFCPLYRAHGPYPLREPWNISPEGTDAFKAILAVDQSRYIMMPYLYTLAARAYYEDYTMMRPLVMDFTDDPEVLDISDEFMCGDALLVCPVYEYKARSREVYLPKGGWYDINDCSRIEGGRRFTAEAPYDRIPVYAREGQIVVTGELVQSTSEAQKELTVTVYSGKDAAFSLYEDDGLSYNYENGEFARTPISWDEASRTLTIGEREGSYEGMIAERPVKVAVVDAAGVHMQETTYNGNGISLKY